MDTFEEAFTHYLGQTRNAGHNGTANWARIAFNTLNQLHQQEIQKAVANTLRGIDFEFRDAMQLLQVRIQFKHRGQKHAILTYADGEDGPLRWARELGGIFQDAARSVEKL